MIKKKKTFVVIIERKIEIDISLPIYFFVIFENEIEGTDPGWPYVDW